MAKTTLDLVKISNDFIKEVLFNAFDYVVYIKPGLTKEETEWITSSIYESDTKITLILEKGIGPFYKGLAEPKSLEIIKNNLDLLDTRFVDKIDICVLLVDDFGLIFNPITATDINEPGDFFNAVLLTGDMVDLLRYRICGIEAYKDNQISNIVEPEVFGKDEIVIDSLVNSIGSIESVLEEYDSSPYNIVELLNIEWKDSADDREKASAIIENTINELKKDPPLELKTIEEYKYYIDNFELLKSRFTGVNLSRKSINLDSFYEVLRNSSSKLKSSWSILGKEDLSIQLNNKLFLECQKSLYEKYEGYITDGGKHGKVIHKDIIKAVVEELYDLLDDYKKFLLLGNNIGNENRFFRMIEKLDDNGNIRQQLDKSKYELIEYLSKQIKDIWDISEEMKRIAWQVFKKYKDKLISEEDAVFQFIEIYVAKVLKFPDLDDIISKIDLQPDIYGITEYLLKRNSELVLKLQNLENIKKQQFDL